MKKIILLVIFIIIAIIVASFFFGLQQSNKYEILIDLNDTSEIFKKEVNQGTTIGQIDVPVREGYIFLYWTFNAEICANEDKIINGMKIVANWSAEDESISKKYIITFDAGNGEIIPSQTIEEGNTVLKPAEPQKDGYVFEYWEFDGREYDFSKQVKFSFGLKAKWKMKDQSTSSNNNNEIKMYNITFDSQGGTIIDSQMVSYGEKVKKPKDPQREGYTFDGWLKGGKVYDFEESVNNDITLVASWRLNTKYSIKVENTKISIEKGKNIEIKIEFSELSPEDWLLTRAMIDNRDIAQISSNVYDLTSYTIYAKKVGKTKLILTHPYDNEIKREIEIIVYENKVEGLNIKCDDMEIGIGSYRYVSPIFTPSNATNKKVYWSSSNQNVATVDELGRVFGINEGTSFITAISDDGSYSDTCTVYVKYIKISKIEISNKLPLHSIEVGDTYQYKIKIYPDNATNKKIYWSSSKPDVASIDQNGKVTALKSGYTIISARIGESECADATTGECTAVTSLTVRK